MVNCRAVDSSKLYIYRYIMTVVRTVPRDLSDSLLPQSLASGSVSWLGNLHLPMVLSLLHLFICSHRACYPPLCHLLPCPTKCFLSFSSFSLPNTVSKTYYTPRYKVKRQSRDVVPQLLPGNPDTDEQQFRYTLETRRLCIWIVSQHSRYKGSGLSLDFASRLLLDNQETNQRLSTVSRYTPPHSHTPVSTDQLPQ